MHLVYLVGRDREVFTAVRRCLEDAAYPVCWFQQPSAMLVSAAKHHPSLIVIHRDIAVDCTHEACRMVRSSPELKHTRLLLLAEGLDEEARIAALDAGADGFISHPLVPRELLWQMMRLQLRTERCTRWPGVPSSPLTIADFAIDQSSMKVTVRGAVVDTTALEFRVLEYLARHQGRVITRNELIQAIWGEGYSGGPRSVDACIQRIRRKVEPNRRNPTYLKAIRGIGYRLDVA